MHCHCYHLFFFFIITTIDHISIIIFIIIAVMRVCCTVAQGEPYAIWNYIIVPPE